MKTNLHTHTVRCKHARGTERDYIEAAIEKGFEILGFSDHVPMPGDDPLVSKIRMEMREIGDYTYTLIRLREEYRGRIELLIGYEAEYIPRFFDEMMYELEKYPLDYMILGQHFFTREDSFLYAGKLSDEEYRLTEYVRTTIEGMRTGLFSYLAHPDLINYAGSEKLYREQMERLISEAIALDIPLEINCLGLLTDRHYPSDRFFSLASEMGADFCIGCDAHDPERILQPHEVPGLQAFLDRNHITRIREATAVMLH